jgi:hypothetical protein
MVPFYRSATGMERAWEVVAEMKQAKKAALKGAPTWLPADSGEPVDSSTPKEDIMETHVGVATLQPRTSQHSAECLRAAPWFASVASHSDLLVSTHTQRDQLTLIQSAGSKLRSSCISTDH